MPTSPLPTHLARLLECIECLGRFGEPQQIFFFIIMETCEAHGLTRPNAVFLPLIQILLEGEGWDSFPQCFLRENSDMNPAPMKQEATIFFRETQLITIFLITMSQTNKMSNKNI